MADFCKGKKKKIFPLLFQDFQSLNGTNQEMSDRNS